MKQYINQLLGDLDLHISDYQFFEENGDVLTIDNECSEDIIELSKLYLTPSVSFAQLLKLEQCYLPPSDKLTIIQINSLYERLTDAIQVHNCYLDFPNDLDCRMKYDILRKNWNEPHMICKDTYNTIDFCDYDQDNCMYGTNCQCKKFEDQS
tara:strand:+ start:30156 stop:30611 length:456 start_codon:yes stop_codon:yes gene_type:complete